jgi:tRNA modification GTPase
MDALESAAAELLADAAPADGSILTNTRQLAAVVRAKESLCAVLESMDLGFTPDAVLVDAEAALEALGEMTGRTMREDVVNRIFERFCVGK